MGYAVRGRIGGQGREAGGLAGMCPAGPSPMALVSLLIVPWRSVPG